MSTLEERFHQFYYEDAMKNCKHSGEETCKCMEADTLAFVEAEKELSRQEEHQEIYKELAERIEDMRAKAHNGEDVYNEIIALGNMTVWKAHPSKAND